MSLRFPAMLVAGTLCLAQTGLAQSAKAADAPNSITVTVDGLACGAPGRNSFTAYDFAVEVNTTAATSGAGGGVGKNVFSDVAVLKPSDACSASLIALAAAARIVPSVTIVQGGTGHAAALTIFLEGVQVVAASSREASDETLDLSYRAITITDAAGSTTGRVVRRPGSAPFTPLARPAPGIAHM